MHAAHGRCKPQLYGADGQLYPIISLHPPPAGSKVALKLYGVQCLASIPPSCAEGCFLHCAPWWDTACYLSNPGEHRAAISVVTPISLAVIARILYNTAPMPFCFCTEKMNHLNSRIMDLLRGPPSLQLIY